MTYHSILALAIIGLGLTGCESPTRTVRISTPPLLDHFLPFEPALLPTDSAEAAFLRIDAQSLNPSRGDVSEALGVFYYMRAHWPEAEQLPGAAYRTARCLLYALETFPEGEQVTAARTRWFGVYAERLQHILLCLRQAQQGGGSWARSSGELLKLIERLHLHPDALVLWANAERLLKADYPRTEDLGCLRQADALLARLIATDPEMAALCQAERTRKRIALVLSSMGGGASP
jgi:hypothetical protein